MHYLLAYPVQEDQVCKVGLSRYSKVSRTAFGLNGKKRIAVLRAGGAILGKSSIHPLCCKGLQMRAGTVSCPAVVCDMVVLVRALCSISRSEWSISQPDGKIS